MIVTDRATGRQPHEHLGRGVGAITRVKHQVFLINRPALAGGDIAPIKSRGDPLLQGWFRQ